MSEPMRIYCGTDESQDVATRVLEWSFRKHATGPIEFHSMKGLAIPAPRDPANRPRTAFSFFRFCIPKLAGYSGRALYVDADMQVFGDVAKLWQLPFGEQRVLCTVQPEAPPHWKNHAFFRPGRQFSVMLLDCSRLDWEIGEIVRRLDEGRLDYHGLLHDCGLVARDAIGETLPATWNHLDHCEPGATQLVHYTVVSTQPWKNDKNHLVPLWMRGFAEAVRDGALERDLVQRAVEKGHVKSRLLRAFDRAKGGELEDSALVKAYVKMRQLLRGAGRTKWAAGG